MMYTGSSELLRVFTFIRLLVYRTVLLLLFDCVMFVFVFVLFLFSFLLI